MAEEPVYELMVPQGLWSGQGEGVRLLVVFLPQAQEVLDRVLALCSGEEGLDYQYQWGVHEDDTLSLHVWWPLVPGLELWIGWPLRWLPARRAVEALREGAGLILTPERPGPVGSVAFERMKHRSLWLSDVTRDLIWIRL